MYRNSRIEKQRIALYCCKSKEAGVNIELVLKNTSGVLKIVMVLQYGKFPILQMEYYNKSALSNSLISRKIKNYLMNKNGPVIVIEDDTDDREMLQEIFQKLNYPNEITFFTDGQEALDYLNRM